MDYQDDNSDTSFGDGGASEGFPVPANVTAKLENLIRTFQENLSRVSAIYPKDSIFTINTIQSFFYIQETFEYIEEHADDELAIKVQLEEIYEVLINYQSLLELQFNSSLIDKLINNVNQLLDAIEESIFLKKVFK